MSDWNIPKDYLDQSKRIEELEKGEASLLQTIKGWQKAYAELEAEVERLKQIEKSYIALHAISGELQAENAKLRRELELKTPKGLQYD
jgi:predicted RNase H-like nuclease (RuvC/YqgF family)